jgi:threonine dehydratase
MIKLQKFKEAKKRLGGIINNTPFAYAPKLSILSQNSIYLKKENLQVTGSFKIRGAYNKISLLSDKDRDKGVIAASAGNHAQGVAFSAKHYGIDATIVMPEATPLTKISGVKAYGADVVLFGANYDEAYAKAIELSKKRGLSFIHPFADDEVIAGQGSIALDILEVKDDLDYIIVPIGGGGLIAGIAMVIKELKPNIKIIGINATGANAMAQSFESKRLIDSTKVKTIADGIAVRDVNPLTFDYVLKYVDEIIEVNDEEIATAILFLLEQQKLLVEGAGAVGVAAIIHDKLKVKDKNIAVLLSGGNIDVTVLSVIIEKGLLKQSRKMKFIVTLVDKPGSLMKLTQILSETDSNIVQIDYDRTSVALDYGEANVTIAVETKGQEHQKLIIDKLGENGYKIKEIL